MLCKSLFFCTSYQQYRLLESPFCMTVSVRCWPVNYMRLFPFRYGKKKKKCILTLEDSYSGVEIPFCFVCLLKRQQLPLFLEIWHVTSWPCCFCPILSMRDGHSVDFLPYLPPPVGGGAVRCHWNMEWPFKNQPCPLPDSIFFSLCPILPT